MKGKGSVTLDSVVYAGFPKAFDTATVGSSKELY